MFTRHVMSSSLRCSARHRPMLVGIPTGSSRCGFKIVPSAARYPNAWLVAASDEVVVTVPPAVQVPTAGGRHGVPAAALESQWNDRVLVVEVQILFAVQLVARPSRPERQRPMLVERVDALAVDGKRVPLGSRLILQIGRRDERVLVRNVAVLTARPLTKAEATNCGLRTCPRLHDAELSSGWRKPVHGHLAEPLRRAQRLLRQRI